jgi:GDPmannose 4,6-dehydratase
VATALIIGVTGQTGSYLAKELLEHNYRVVGTTRGAGPEIFWRHEILGLTEQVEIETLDPGDFASVLATLKKFAPQVVFFLGGQSSVGQSFHTPHESFHSIVTPVTHVLEAIRTSASETRFVNSSSTEAFGNQPDVVLDESSLMVPVSPYGYAKAASHAVTMQYRRLHGVLASNAILSNHESPLRGDQFVTKQIVTQLRAIARGAAHEIRVGNIDVVRDWVWAPDVAHALRLIGEAKTAEDYVVATGESHSLREMIMQLSTHLGLAPALKIVTDSGLLRPYEIQSVRTNPAKIRSSLGWSPRVSFEALTKSLVDELPGFDQEGIR